TKPVSGIDLAKKSDQELVDLQWREKNDWYVRHARRILQERHALPGHDPKTADALEDIAFAHKNEGIRLRALWALHACGGLNEQRVHRGLTDSSLYVRAWTIQLAMENGSSSSDFVKSLAD